MTLDASVWDPSGVDAASLRSALRELHDWDADLGALFDLEQEATSHRAPRSHLTRRSTSSTTKLELARLRDEARVLEATLDNLRTELWRAEAQSSDEAFALHCERLGIIKRQHDLRILAETENTKLRELLKSHASAVRKVLALMRSANRNRGGPGDHYEGPSRSLGLMASRLDELARESDRIFSSALFAAGKKGERRDLSFCVSRTGVIQVDLVVSWLLPFNVDDVADVIWDQTARMERRGRRFKFEDGATDANTCVSNFSSESTISALEPMDDRAIGSTRGQVACRRQKSFRDQSVLIVSSVDSAVFNAKGHSLGFMAWNAWQQIESIPTSAKSSGLSRVRWYRRIEGSPPPNFASTPEKRNEWIRFITEEPMPLYWRKGLDAQMQAIENVLVSRASRVQVRT